MKLKPISALSDFLGKLVVEHGAAIITEKNLVFLRDQLAAAEKEIKRLTADNQKLTAEMDNLKEKIHDCENRNKKLLNTISKLKEKQIHDKPPKRPRSGWVNNWRY